MKQNLKECRKQYAAAIDTLRAANRNKGSYDYNKEYISIAFIELNRARTQLLREMQRVSYLLWPETGRPYYGLWIVVIGSTNNIILHRSSMLDCVKYLETSCPSSVYQSCRIEKANG
jgi:hypothetical protein